MTDKLWEEWQAWSRANPETDIEPDCECERKEMAMPAMLSALTPEMIAGATRAIFGAQK